MLRAAVIGCGRVGFEFDNDTKRRYIASHTRAYRFVKDTRLVAVCDIDGGKSQRCANKLGLSGSYVNFKKMLKKERIDILSICTPPQSHYAIVKEAVNFPILAIFCEKPLADNLRDAKKIVDLCDKKKIILQVDHQRRFDHLHIKIRDFIRRGHFGKIQQINFYYTAGLKNTGSHMFDLLRFLFGDVKWIEGVYGRNSSGNTHDPNIDGMLQFRNGALATFQSCDVKNYLIFELNCFSQKGKIIIKNSGFSVDFYTPAQSKYFTGYKELCKSKPPFGTAYKRDFMVNGVRNLVRCIRKNKEPVSSGKDGLAAMRLIEAALTSAENNGKRIFLNKGKNG